MNNYFDFIMFLAFQVILKYENKRSLTLEQLHNYRVKLCEKHIKYHGQFTEYSDEEFEKNLRSFHTSNMSMTMEEEERSFLEFIKNNDELFLYKDGIISLKDEVTYRELEDAKFELDSYSNKDDKLICGELIGSHDCVECLDILCAQKIKESVYKIIDDEKKIEKAYQTLTGIELEQNIQKLLSYVNYRLVLIGNLRNDKMGCYSRVISSCGYIDPEAEGEDIWLLSDYLMDRDKFYRLNGKYIDYIISNKFQRAIFDTGTLVYYRLGGIMSAMWAYREPDAEIEIEPVDEEATLSLMEERMEQIDAYEDEFDDDDNDGYDDYDEEFYMDQVELYLHDKKINMAFYLNYINHINEFSKKHGVNEVLETTKKRLLYLLDSYGDDLYKDENFRNALNNMSMETFDYKEDFDGFYILSRLFLVDILEGWVDDDMTLRKMLFASTYYDLTEDKRIKRVINKYKKTETGRIVSTAIFEHYYSKLNSNLSESPKRLIKKNNDSDNG